MPFLPTEWVRSLRSRPLRLLPFATLAAAVAHFVAASPRYALTRLPLDDGWTHQVYASALASGQGFAYNPGTQEAGFTSPLWVMVTAPLHWLAPFGTHVVIVAIKALGVLLAGWVVWETARLGREWAGELGGVLAGSVIALEPRLVFSALSGMETLLAIGLWLGATRAVRDGRWAFLGVCVALAPLARPEMLVLWPLAALAWLFLRLRAHPRPRHQVATAALVALPVVGWIVYCLAVNGHPLPNTFYAKAHSVVGNPLVVAGLALYYLGQHGLLATVAGWLAAAGFAGFALRRRESPGRWTALLLLGGPFLYAFGVVFTRDLHPSGYYWTRWVDPASLVLTATVAVGMAVLAETLVERWRQRAEGRARDLSAANLVPGFTVVVLLALVAQAGTVARSWQDRRTHLVSDARAITLLNVAVGVWLREHTAPTDVVAVNDAGAIRFFSQRETLDLLGLNSAPIALGTRTRDELLEERDVRWLAIFPGWFDDAAGEAMLRRFEPRTAFEIPPEEYTVCDCPTQTRIVIYERRRDARGSSPTPSPSIATAAPSDVAATTPHRPHTTR